MIKALETTPRFLEQCLDILENEVVEPEKKSIHDLANTDDREPLDKLALFRYLLFQSTLKDVVTPLRAAHFALTATDEEVMEIALNNAKSLDEAVKSLTANMVLDIFMGAFKND